MNLPKTIVTKAEYAALKKREPSCISNWIAQGKITTAALVGEGVRARIWVERADADLAASLDPSQQFAQDNPVLPPDSAPEAGENLLPLTPSADRPSEAASRGGKRDINLDRRLAADAEKAEQEAIAARRRNAIEDGRWIEAAGAQREFAKQLSRLVAETETFLFNTLSRSLAESHTLDWKALSTEIRAAWRAHRAQFADAARDALTEREAAIAAEQLPIAPAAVQTGGDADHVSLTASPPAASAQPPAAPPNDG